MLMEQLSTFGGYGFAIIMTGIAVVCWRKALYLNTLLLENINLQNEARQSLQELERDQKRLNQKYENARGTQSRAERHSEDLRTQLAEESAKVELLQSKMKIMLEKARNQRDHLIVQNEAMTHQLRLADQERSTAERELTEFRQSVEKNKGFEAKEKQAELANLQRELSNSRKETENWRRKCDKISAELVKVDPIATRKIRKRNLHLEHLYQSMKGLKEMAEERSANWETALRHLSIWTLSTQCDDLDTKSNRNKPIGPLVAEALQSIGSELVNDEHTSLNADFSKVETNLST